MTTKKPKLPIIPFASPEVREEWLEEHHTTSDGFCLKWWVRNKYTGVWLSKYRRLTIRYERRDDIHEAFVHLGCSLIRFNCLS